MTKLALMVCSLFAINHFGNIDLSTIAHLGDYAIAVVVALLAMPWVSQQFDA